MGTGEVTPSPDSGSASAAAAIGGQRTSGAAVRPPLRIPIRPDWDLTCTYDALDRASDTQGIFVGRDELLEPLIAALAQPGERGTFLISGYRGSGKTTLLVQALLEARSEERRV